MLEPCLSLDVIDHFLKPIKDQWLGKLLSHQLPNPV